MTMFASYDMRPEEIARRFAVREGFRLVNYAEVGLPVYALTLRMLVLARKRVPPIDEFVLRSVGSGLSSPEEISGLLGLESEIIQGSIVELLRSDDLVMGAPSGDSPRSLQLTVRGRESVTELVALVPEERTQIVYFDGLLRRPCWFERSQLYLPRELKELGWAEIPPYRTRPPTMDDVERTDVESTLREARGGRPFPYDILALKELEGRKRFYFPAIALVYKSVDDGELQVSFVVDGRPTLAHEDAFARANGVRKLRIAEALAESGGVEALRPELGDDFATAIPSESDMLAAQREADLARIELSDAQQRVVDSEPGSEQVTAKEDLDRATKAAQAAEAALNEWPVRTLEVYDHPAVLRSALEESRQRMMIISPWIRRDVVDRAFLKRVEDLLKRNVLVVIGYGFGVDRKQRAGDVEAEAELEHLASRFAHMTFKRLGDTHAKILISDDRFLVVTSFNWLSFRGDPKRGFRDEQGMLLSLPDMVNKRWQELIGRFGSDG